MKRIQLFLLLSLVAAVPLVAADQFPLRLTLSRSLSGSDTRADMPTPTSANTGIHSVLLTPYETPTGSGSGSSAGLAPVDPLAVVSLWSPGAKQATIGSLNASSGSSYSSSSSSSSSSGALTSYSGCASSALSGYGASGSSVSSSSSSALNSKSDYKLNVKAKSFAVSSAASVASASAATSAVLDIPAANTQFSVYYYDTLTHNSAYQEQISQGQLVLYNAPSAPHLPTYYTVAPPHMASHVPAYLACPYQEAIRLAKIRELYKRLTRIPESQWVSCVEAAQY